MKVFTLTEGEHYTTSPGPTFELTFAGLLAVTTETTAGHTVEAWGGDRCLFRCRPPIGLEVLPARD